MTMIWIIATLLTVTNLALLFVTLLGLPGTWLMVVLTALVAWWQWSPAALDGDPMISLPILIALVVLALLGELVELIAGVLGAKQFGGTNRSAWAALVGTFVGGLLGTFFIPLPPVGSLIGACAGAAIGALSLELHDKRPLREAIRSGTGAGLGRLVGTGAKFFCGVLIWITATVAAFWP